MDRTDTASPTAACLLMYAQLASVLFIVKADESLEKDIKIFSSLAHVQDPVLFPILFQAVPGMLPPKINLGRMPSLFRGLDLLVFQVEM